LTEKDKIIRYFEQKDFKNKSIEHVRSCFTCERIRVELEDNNWDDICFDIFIENVYVTCATSLKEIKQLFKVLQWD
jgi:hypothetical protein